MKVALIGLGMVSSTYADALPKIAGLELKGVHARSAESRLRYLSKHPGPIDFASIKEIADDDEIDFAIITTPPNARREIVDILANAGKHILMEKPVERTYSAALELCEICESKEVKLGIVLQHRARPSAQQMRKLMDTSALGPLVMVEVNVPWWREQSYYDEPGRGTYERDGGGVLISQAIHTLDLMLSLTGPVRDVTAMMATTSFHQMEAEDFATAGLTFENGAVGTLFATTAAFPGRAEGIRLQFAKASVELESNSLSVNYHNGKTETFGALAATGSGADPMAFSSDWHRAIIEDFVQAISEDRSPLVSGREALEVHRLIEALERSAELERKQTIIRP